MKALGGSAASGTGTSSSDNEETALAAVAVDPPKQNTICGSLSNIPIGEENALLFGQDLARSASSITSNLIYPTAGVTLGGDMISDGPVSAVAVRKSQDETLSVPDFGAPTDGSDTENWIIATVNREYIKMLHITVKKASDGLLMYAVAAGYLNIHSLHSFGNSYNVQSIQTVDLSSTIVRQSWSHRVEQETRGYQLTLFNYCICHTLDVSLPVTKFDSLSLAVPTSDAEAIILTDSHTVLSGSQITHGPVKCKAYRSTNVSPSADKALWLLATVNDAYIKIVEVTISHAEATTGEGSPDTAMATATGRAGSLSVYASNSGYAMYKEFGTAETEALSGRVVNAAWNKMIPNSYEVSGLSYYVQQQE